MKITKLLLPESQPAHALLVRAKKVVLTYAQRVKTPAEFSVDGVTYENALGDVPPLEVGDVLVDEKGSFLVVEAAPDEIMKVSGDHELMQEAVYAFTARGIRVAPTEDGFAIMANDTFRSMLENVGLKTETVTEPFVPVALPQPHHGGCGCGCGGDEECSCGCGHHHHDDECGCGCGHHHHDDDDDEDEHEHHHEHGDHCCCGHHHHHHHDGHDADEVFVSWGMETHKKFTTEQIEGILKQLEDAAQYGMVLRAKGYVASNDSDRWIHFDYVPGESDIREGGAMVTGRVCVIGSKLNESAIASLFGA